MNTKWSIISCCAVLMIGCGVLAFCNQSEQNQHTEKDHQDDRIVMMIAIYPTGTYDETYLFVLNRDGGFACSYGTRNSDDFTQWDFLRTTAASSDKTLNNSEMQMLIDLADRVESEGSSVEKQIFTDSWDVTLLYNGRIYEMNYWYNNGSGAFADLAHHIIGLSPVPVDLHAWA